MQTNAHFRICALSRISSENELNNHVPTLFFVAADGEHMSHPIHSDNCILGLNGPNSCPQVSPAYVWRDFR